MASFQRSQPESLVEFARRPDEAATRGFHDDDDDDSGSSSGDSVEALGCDCARCPHDDQPTTFKVSAGLIQGCHFCGTDLNFTRCGLCKVVFYCSQKNKRRDRAAHETSCNKIKQARFLLQNGEISLRQHAGDVHTPREAFRKAGEAYGHFWDYHITRPYMRQRKSLVEALLTVNTARAVEEALSHCLEMLDLDHNDNQGIRGYVPPLYLRLGRNQECFDFVKWWLVNWGSEYEWGDPRGELKMQESTERGIDLSDGFNPLSHLVSLTLLYIRDFLPWCLGKHANGVNAGHREESMGAERRARELAADAYVAVYRANRHFWGVLLDPMDELNLKSDAYEMGSFEQVPHTLQQCYNSWAETRFAFDVLGEMMGWEEVKRALRAKANVHYVTT